ncbi:uncharacterized protein LOC133184747 [Saccostrea echinata]|uniref:uncharacterized protein LOC133184747 n=1 Tax=Saccostrea echinata TaxID=191078 RepID=UPI002A7FC78B|nr:uncharacterized protein LOC133184747 [Saccostrea echinata]
MKRKSLTETVSVPKDMMSDISHLINDTPFDWKDYKIPKRPRNFNHCYNYDDLPKNPIKDQTFQRKKPQNCYSSDDFEMNRRSRGNSYEEHNPKHQMHRKYTNSRNQQIETGRSSSQEGSHPDDFAISRRDRVEIRRKNFEENYWKSQMQRRYGNNGQNESWFPQTYQQNWQDPRLQRTEATTTMSNGATSCQALQNNSFYRSRDSQTPGKARRELFVKDGAKQRREKEYEERLRKEFEKEKQGRITQPISCSPVLRR